MSNPHNQISQAAKKAGLSYWDYVAKKFPGTVKEFVWGEKKLTRKQEREGMAMVNTAMANSSHPAMRMLSRMGSMLGNSHY
jgi:hypothetical protein